MKGRIVPFVAAAIFLTVAVYTGRLASQAAWEDNISTEAVSSGIGQIGSFLADMLWLQLDQYHHIWMYQGNEWVTATDYLPQLWLIIKLDPSFADAYIDGGYQLAINLDEKSEGIRLLQEGVRQCPENERVLWEYAVVLWETDYYSPRETEEATWQYLRIIREKRGLIEEAWNEGNAYFLLEKAFEQDSLRRNNLEISRRYSNRRSFIRRARSEGIWTTDD
ncbi:MAG: hypothetical protein KAW14_14120 [Candidatus Aegiribacteria sp.]|nr:hypothetical protein [Candidatus Aegiribacteria sp.]